MKLLGLILLRFASLVVIGYGLGMKLINPSYDETMAIVFGFAFAIISVFLWKRFSEKFNF